MCIRDRIRTGPLPPGPAAVRLKPVRDALGFAVQPARLRLVPEGAPVQPDGVQACVQVDREWLKRLSVGSQIALTDARGKSRRLLVVEAGSRGALADTLQTCYLTPDVALTVKVATAANCTRPTHPASSHCPARCTCTAAMCCVWWPTTA
mgnify:CR=1 FL=1